LVHDVFGRDTLITCLQTLVFGPELARGALQVPPICRRPTTIPTSTPSRGRSSTRFATARPRRRGLARYYGTSTPHAVPYLLSEVWRWTDDTPLVRGLKEPALRASSLD